MSSSQRGATGEKAISHREAGERHRTEDREETEESEDTEGVWVTLSGEAKREAQAIVREWGNIAGIGSDWRGICLLAHRGMRRNSRHEMVV
jgi:hypothetical protein